MSAAFDPSALTLLIVSAPGAERNQLMHLAESAGIKRIRAAENAVQAFGVLARERPDATLVDAQLRPTDGLTFIRELRATAIPHRGAPMLLMTHGAAGEALLDAERAGADGVIALPIEEADFLHALAHLKIAGRDLVEGEDYGGPERRGRRTIAFAGAERRIDPPAAPRAETKDAAARRLIARLLDEAQAGVASWSRTGAESELIDARSALDVAAQLAVEAGMPRILRALTAALVVLDHSRRTWDADERKILEVIESARLRLRAPASTNANI